MRRRVMASVGLAVVTAVVVVVVLMRGGDDGPSAQAVVPGLEARTVDAGEVDVTIEPLQIDDRSAVVVVTLDTHSVELSADLARTATLGVGGAEWPVAAWSGDEPGGHHREGELSFEPGGPATGTVQLSISGLGDPVDATWTLEG